MIVNNPLNKYLALPISERQAALSRKELALAWLQLNFEGVPHPDDTDDWGGWQKDLRDAVFMDNDYPDALHYAAFLGILISYSIPLLRTFHADLSEEEQDLLLATDVIADFFSDVNVEDLDKVIIALERLLTYHPDGPEDVVAHLQTAYEVLAAIRIM